MRAAPAQIRRHERIFAVLFALLYFALLSLPLWGALLIPLTLPYIVVVYDCYWTIQALYSTWCGIISFRRLLASRQVDWRARYVQLEQPVQQLVVIPNYKERSETLAATLRQLTQNDYPSEQLHMVLAMEEREAGAMAKAEALRAEFAHCFGQFWITLHPLLPNETAWKGANLSYALRQVKKHCDELGWNADRVLVTTLDADTRLERQYLAALAVKLLSVPRPTRLFFQGILILMNNIWEVHAPIRALTAFWTFTYVTGIQHYARMTTAVYSMSLRLLEDVGYWDPRVLVDDGHIFFRAFFALKGCVDICPIYLSVGLDAVHARDLWTTLRNQYRQMSRWAWAASNMPFIGDQWVRHDEISWWQKFQKCVPYVESLLFMPSAWFIITFGVIVPPLINPTIQPEVFGWRLSTLSPLILAPSLIGAVIALFINIQLRQLYAPRPRPVTRLYRIWQWAEWLLFPLAALFYFSLPYIQTYWRLLRGKDLQAEPTPK